MTQTLWITRNMATRSYNRSSLAISELPHIINIKWTLEVPQQASHQPCPTEQFSRSFTATRYPNEMDRAASKTRFACTLVASSSTRSLNTTFRRLTCLFATAIITHGSMNGWSVFHFASAIECVVSAACKQSEYITPHINIIEA
jgi:hypothetical protein